MRLIDADKVKRAFIGNRYGTKAIEYVIDDAPTVKAITVEWINKYKRVRGWEVTVTTQNAIDNMLNAWEKENGKDSE